MKMYFWKHDITRTTAHMKRDTTMMDYVIHLEIIHLWRRSLYWSTTTASKHLVVHDRFIFASGSKLFIQRMAVGLLELGRRLVTAWRSFPGRYCWCRAIRSLHATGVKVIVVTCFYPLRLWEYVHFEQLY